jgi:hypothetical protein
MGPYEGFYYNLTLCPLQGQLQHIYHGQPYARVDLNPKPESTLDLANGEALQTGKPLLVSLRSQLPSAVNLDLRPMLNAYIYLVGLC